MKVTFLKDHLEHKAGEAIDVEEARANYWERCGVAEKDSKAGPAKTEKNSKAGPKKNG